MSYAVRYVRGHTIPTVTFEAEKLMTEYQEHWRVIATNLIMTEGDTFTPVLWYMVITMERR